MELNSIQSKAYSISFPFFRHTHQLSEAWSDEVIMNTNSHFRRAQSKIYYASDIWDPGSSDQMAGDQLSGDQFTDGHFTGDQEFARTSFRSSCSEMSTDDFGNNDDFVASLMRRRALENPSNIYDHEEINNEPFDVSENTDDFLEEEESFALPTYAKPLPLLGHPSRHSVLNR